MIYIVTAVHNRWDMTRRFLGSLEDQTVRGYKIILVDDGSTDDTVEQLNVNYPSVHVIKGNGHLWWTGSIRLGCDYVLDNYPDAEYIIVANNDQVIAEDAIERLLYFSKKNPDTIIGPVSKDFSSPEMIYDGGCHIDWKKFRFTLLPVRETGMETDGIDAVSGRFTLIPIGVFSVINFDSERFPHYLGDLDFFQQARRYGYNIGVCNEVICYDIGGFSGYAAKPAEHGLIRFFELQFKINSHDNLIHRIRFIWKNCPSQVLKYFNILKCCSGFLYGFTRSLGYSIFRPLIYLNKRG